MDTVHVEFPEDLGRLALFADLPEEEIDAIARGCDNVSFREGEWIIRQGDPPSALYMIVEGDVAVVLDDVERRVLSKGSFFGDVSVLLQEPASASIITRTPVSCLIVPAPDVEDFLVSHPQVTYRIVRAQARRLKTASEWRT